MPAMLSAFIAKWIAFLPNGVRARRDGGLVPDQRPGVFLVLSASLIRVARAEIRIVSALQTAGY